MVEVIRAFCWHQKIVLKGFSALAPGLYTELALPVAIIAKCEEKIFLAQKNVIWRKQMAKKKKDLKKNRHPIINDSGYLLPRFHTYKSPIKP